MTISTKYIDPIYVERADAKLKAGDVSGGWSALAEGGDNYALAAAEITRKGPDKTFAQVLVEETWENTVGMDLYHAKFDAVAHQHLTQYLKVIRREGGKLPDTRDIEKSYAKALTDNDVSTDAAIDGILNRMGVVHWVSMLDLFDFKWSDAYDIDSSRISDDTHLMSSHSRLEAALKVMQIGTETTHREWLELPLTVRMDIARRLMPISELGPLLAMGEELAVQLEKLIREAEEEQSLKEEAPYLQPQPEAATLDVLGAPEDTRLGAGSDFAAIGVERLRQIIHEEVAAMGMEGQASVAAHDRPRGVRRRFGSVSALPHARAHGAL